MRKVIGGGWGGSLLDSSVSPNPFPLYYGLETLDLDLGIGLGLGL